MCATGTLPNKSKSQTKPKYGLWTAFGAKVPNDLDSWYVDSACAPAHLTGRSNWLQDFKTDHNGVEVTVANNSKLYSQGCGDVPLQDDTVCKISDAVYVLNLSANLLSVSKTVENEYVVVFDKSGCKMYRNDAVTVNGTISLTASNVNGMYKLDVKVSEVGTAFAMKTQASNADLWHQYLGHLCRFKMNLFRQDPITDVKYVGHNENP